MSDPRTTCWAMVEGAAGGRREDRETFAARYEPVIRAYLGARWRGSRRLENLDDTVQEVFVECFREGGALDRVDAGRPGGFRAFLFGVCRNVALRAEAGNAMSRKLERADGFALEDVPQDEATLSWVFDRAWALELIRQAADQHQARARERGGGAERRVEVLRLRFQEDLPIREIARRWGTEAAEVHHQYAQAREEFKEALLEVVKYHLAGRRGGECTPGEAERECSEILDVLSG